MAFTSGVSAELIGVMVAVALLLNLICVNLAGVVTFLIQGIRPVSWWEKGQAVKATRIAIGLGLALLAGLVVIILLMPKD